MNSSELTPIFIGGAIKFVPSAVKAEECGISQRQVAILRKEGRVPGAELVGNRWFFAD